MTPLASVQTAADTQPLTWFGVLMAMTAVFLLCLIVAAPALIAAWRQARRDIDNARMEVHR